MNTSLKFLIVLLLWSTNGCTQKSSKSYEAASYKTKNVIILVIDGPRYTETWGDSTHQYIPRLSRELAQQGVNYTHFYNDGPTYTNAGHTAVTTGLYQEINNNGKELPLQASIFQHWLKKYNQPGTAAWVIASKDKLEVLADARDSLWHGQYRPATDCGINGLATGYRKDSVTFVNTIATLSTAHPQLVLINFRDPDSFGHDNNWEGYLQGIQNSDEYLYKLWQFLEGDPFYKGSTTVFVTNDHGRHLDSVKDGFINHGCDCEGCRHINLFAIGPDFKKGIVENTRRGQIDIPATVAELLDFELPEGKGQVMTELFEKIPVSN